MGKLLASLIAIAIMVMLAWPRSEPDASGKAKYKDPDNVLQGAIIELLERSDR